MRKGRGSKEKLKDHKRQRPDCNIPEKQPGTFPSQPEGPKPVKTQDTDNSDYNPVGIRNGRSY